MDPISIRARFRMYRNQIVVVEMQKPLYIQKKTLIFDVALMR